MSSFYFKSMFAKVPLYEIIEIIVEKLCQVDSEKKLH